MFYVTSIEYVGPNLDKRLNSKIFSVKTAPGRTNMSHEPLVSGWLGTSNDWYAYAHGEFDTLDAARQYVETSVGGLRRVEEPDELGDEEFIEAWHGSQFEEMSEESSERWCYDWMLFEVSAETSDEEILKAVAEAGAEANAEGFSLHTEAVRKMFTGYRNRKKEEADE